MTAGHPTIVVTNHSTVVSAADLAKWMPAFQYACSYQFAPSWGSSCHLLIAGPDNVVPKGAWELSFLNDSDQADALGYHDETADGFPLAKIFAHTDLVNGYSVPVTGTHELWEMLADPDLSRAYQTGNAEFTALEVGDPVEADIFGYRNKAHPDVLISDFILPSWFGQGFQAVGRYDHAGHCKQPNEVPSGGYVSLWEGKGGWTTKQMRNGELVEVAPDSQRVRNRG